MRCVCKGLTTILKVILARKSHHGIFCENISWYILMKCIRQRSLYTTVQKYSTKYYRLVVKKFLYLHALIYFKK